MFTYVIVAFVILLGLTAFVPKVRGWMQWLYKKAALVVNLVLILAFYAVVELVLLAVFLVVGTGYLLGSALKWIGSRVFDLLANAEDANIGFAQPQIDKAFKRFK